MVTFRRSALTLILFLALSALNAQTPLIQKVLDQESSRFEAMIKADTSALRPMLAEDLIYVHSNGMKESKTDHLNAIAARKLVYQKMERQEANVRFYGKMTLVNGKLKAMGLINNNVFDIQLAYLAVYHKKKGVWQLVSWQSTRLL